MMKSYKKKLTFKSFFFLHHSIKYLINEAGSILSIFTSDADSILLISIVYLGSFAAFIIFFLKSGIEKIFL